MADIFMLNPHERMTVQEALEYAAREHAEFEDVMVIAYDKDGELMVRSSAMSRAEAVFMLLAALDHARGK